LKTGRVGIIVFLSYDADDAIEHILFYYRQADGSIWENRDGVVTEMLGW
jgi:hypothetical protein